MSATPICDAIDERFNAWDAQIEDLKNQTKEAAKEQVKKIKKDIEDYTKSKEKELNKQDEETQSKTQAAEAINEIKGGISKVEEAVGAINKILTFLGDAAEQLIAVAADISQAPAKLTKRSAETLSKLTEI